MFGTYLVKKGLVSHYQVLQALEVQRSQRVPLGKLAMASGKLSVKQVFEILNSQEHGGELRFGETAIRLGYMSASELQEMLDKQGQTRRPIGEIMVELGIITRDELDRELASYQAEGKSSEAATGTG